MYFLTYFILVECCCVLYYTQTQYRLRQEVIFLKDLQSLNNTNDGSKYKTE